ncbi:MAG TPA: DUF488 domain-containing protein [bacterium]|jgi:uncharacterized protein (DUF488 family)
MPLYSIGHSNHDSGRLVSLLKKHSIKIVIDIRRVPYSGRFPHFNRDRLSELCRQNSIEYTWRGETLGGDKGTDKSMTQLAADSLYRAAVKILSDEYSAPDSPNGCLLCAEKEPSDCHRAKLVGKTLRELKNNPVDVIHIKANGRTVLQSDLEASQLIQGGDRAGTLSLFD